MFALGAGFYLDCAGPHTDVGYTEGLKRIRSILIVDDIAVFAFAIIASLGVVMGGLQSVGATFGVLAIVNYGLIFLVKQWLNREEGLS